MARPAVRLIVTISVCLGVACLPVWAQDARPTELPDAPSSVAAATPWPSRPSSSPPGPCQPQATPAESLFRQTLKRVLQDQREIYTAPFHRSAVQWDLGFLALTGGLIASDRPVSGGLPSDHLSVSRDISNAGLYATTASLGGLWLTGEATHDPHAREAGTLGAEGLTNAAAVYAVMQLVAGRQRPLEGDGGGHFGKHNALSSSFPSGHAMFTWTEASIIAHEYPKPWVQWLAYGTATAVSVTRFTGKEHFPADVVVGSAFGYLIGRHIFHSRCQVGLSSACSARHRK